MKKINYYAFIMCTFVILTLSIFSIVDCEITKNYKSVDNNNLSKFLQSSILEATALTKNVRKENSKNALVLEGTKKVQIVDNYLAIDTTNHQVLETYHGTISYYGPDCGGCISGKTASGYKISSDITTYKDNTYGNLRIVAGDYKYPFGTIVRFTYQNGTQELAILLDRGGVGLSKKYQFDLLVSSEEESYRRGVSSNTKIEILRYGY